MVLYYPDLMVGKFHIMEVDGEIYTIVDRHSDDEFSLVRPGGNEPEPVHIDEIVELVTEADEVRLKKR